MAGKTAPMPEPEFAPLKKRPDSGYVQLADGHDAFAARMMLVENAVSTLDIQYYIWEYNLTGRLLFEALERAAERGVTIRLLLDDNNTANLDHVLVRLQRVDGIDIRLFNPLRNRRLRLLNYLTDFNRLNRRMHNKTFTADGKASIIGGRNIGDAYFNAGSGLYFIDLDLLVSGSIVGEIAEDFERYWSSSSSWPLEKVMGRRFATLRHRIEDEASVIDSDPDARAYLHRLKHSPYATSPDQLDFEKTQAELISDDPAKGAGKSDEKMLMQHRLAQLSVTPARELLLVAPYFIPGRRGADYFKRLLKKGVKISVLTNAFEATDVAIVHSGYRKYRRELVRAGVRIFELKRTGDTAGQSQDGFSVGRSGASLHAKTFSIDRSMVYVGSHNFDPRSSHLNTEMGVLVNSAELAQSTVTIFEETLPAAAYEVRIGEKGRLVWVERDNGEVRVHHREPGMAWYHKVWIYLASKLPIEWLL